MEKNKKHLERFDEMLKETKVSDLLKYISGKVVFTTQYDYNWITGFMSGKSKKCYFKYDRIKENIRSAELKYKLVYHQDKTIGEMFPCLSYTSRNEKRQIVSNDSLLKHIVTKGYMLFYSEYKSEIYIVHGIEDEKFCSNDKTEELKRVKENLNFIRTEMRRLAEMENKYKAIERGIENHIEIHNSINGKTPNLY